MCCFLDRKIIWKLLRKEICKSAFISTIDERRIQYEISYKRIVCGSLPITKVCSVFIFVVFHSNGEVVSTPVKSIARIKNKESVSDGISTVNCDRFSPIFENLWAKIEYFQTPQNKLYLITYSSKPNILISSFRFFLYL